MTIQYEHAIVKFNNGNGALLCNACDVIIAYGSKHEDREHYCPMCMSGKCTTRNKDENKD